MLKAIVVEKIKIYMTGVHKMYLMKSPQSLPRPKTCDDPSECTNLDAANGGSRLGVAQVKIL